MKGEMLVHILTRPFLRSGKKPTFILAGAPRSGTTTLYDLLKRHPQIYMSPIKEIQYFSAYYNNSQEWYISQFTPPNYVSQVGEASTNYLYYEKAAKRIYEFKSDMRLIFIFRDPVERAYSHYKREVQTHGVKDQFYNLINESDHFIKPGRYYTHINRFREYFPDDQLLILLFEEFVDSPQVVLDRIQDFLGLTEKFEDINSLKRTNPSRHPLFPSLQRVIYRFFGQRDGEPVTLRYMKGGARLLFTWLNCRTKSVFPSISRKEKEFLRQTYRPEVKGLNTLLEKNLGDFWSFDV